MKNIPNESVSSPAILEQANKLEAELELLTTTAENLAARLSQVLAPSSPQETYAGKTDAPKRVMSPLGDRIQCAEERAVTVRKILQDCIARVEV